MSLMVWNEGALIIKALCYVFIFKFNLHLKIKYITELSKKKFILKYSGWIIFGYLMLYFLWIQIMSVGIFAQRFSSYMRHTGFELPVGKMKM